MQASLLLPSLIRILTLCRPPYHEAPETPPKRARAGHPVATEKRVKTRRTGIPPTTRATMPRRKFARHDGRNSESPPLPPENGLTGRETPTASTASTASTAPTAQHVAAPTQPHRFRTTTDAPHHRTPTTPHRAALPCPTPRRTAQTHRSEARRHPTPRRKRPRILMDPGAFVMCGGRDYLRYTFS